MKRGGDETATKAASGASSSKRMHDAKPANRPDGLGADRGSGVGFLGRARRRLPPGSPAGPGARAVSRACGVRREPVAGVVVTASEPGADARSQMHRPVNADCRLGPPERPGRVWAAALPRQTLPTHLLLENGLRAAHRRIRAYRWIESGRPWFSGSREKPAGWPSVEWLHTGLPRVFTNVAWVSAVTTSPRSCSDDQRADEAGLMRRVL
jgi:hypothetical protein